MLSEEKGLPYTDHQVIYDQKQELTIKHCSSVGADGVIYVVVETEDVVDWYYYNRDGSTVEMCGNGARCVVQWA